MKRLNSLKGNGWLRQNLWNGLGLGQKFGCRLLAIPFWIVEERKTHSVARLERGQINEKRLGESEK